ncbi:N-acetylmuramoyl-L-alanine amidase [Chitinophaga polysaccharea]|uniref:N-acetylmuramoyl-L-alanine amidase n=1 Tax=Chitinophaga TaxID=79328 RepID=UPI001455D41C|nr:MULTISPECIES: N-acetylmuramoyl-L-alanine amidase [Chitinophaga]NLR61043.1 N-acetylmuramoyl-L-alanine amidase [Chitinophaga polysaccharea]NLU96252.1 N-acetylmuramoyl-L-alanine amidase [Chitinophaga sp. Ak27]
MKTISFFIRFSCLAAVVFGATYCARNPYAATNKEYRHSAKSYAKVLREQPGALAGANGIAAPSWVGTVNFNMRKPNLVIIHHTAQNSCEQTLKTFTLQKTQVSAHYVICRNGTIHHMLNDYLRAWHGGVAKWGNLTDINSSSIGIELDNNGKEPFDSAQISSLLVLLDTLQHRYNIPAANFVGHGDIAPGRKVDPSAFFPWQQLADKGFGLWYKDTSATVVPESFNSLLALRIIGYDVKDSSAAIMAFKRHFMPTDSLPGLSDAGKKILLNLQQQYQ